MKENKMLLTICCITYNHKNTIRRSIDGFLMQKTTFNYEIYIHDDCSTDGTIDILKEYENKYPNKINVIYQKENQFSKGKKGLKDFIFPKINSKYIALCEGDDWWIDENKLQIQVDLLESNNSLTGCFHLTEMIDLETNKFVEYYPFKKGKRKKIFSLKNGFFEFPTSSVIYRFDKFKDDILSLYPKNIINGDTWFASFYLLNGNIAYINKAMSVRTINGNGIWEGINAQNTKYIKYSNEFINFPIEMERLFDNYNKKSPFNFVEYFEPVVDSAIANKEEELLNNISRKYFDNFYKSNKRHKINLVKKYKKYKHYMNLLICCNLFLLLIILLLFQ